MRWCMRHFPSRLWIMTNLRFFTGLLSACVCGVLAGCMAVPAPDAAHLSGSPTPTVAADAVMETGDPEGVAAEPTWDASSRAAARTAAERAVAAWINTSRGETVWRAGLVSWLSLDAQAFYASVDPRSIAAGAVAAGGSRLVDESSPYLARVHVETSAGSYEVLLNRASGTESWQAQRVTLIGGAE